MRSSAPQRTRLSTITRRSASTLRIVRRVRSVPIAFRYFLEIFFAAATHPGRPCRGRCCGHCYLNGVPEFGRSCPVPHQIAGGTQSYGAIPGTGPVIGCKNDDGDRLSNDGVNRQMDLVSVSFRQTCVTEGIETC